MKQRVSQTGRTPQEIEAYLKEKEEKLADRVAIELMHWHRRTAGCDSYSVWADESDVAQCACLCWRPTDPNRTYQILMVMKALWEKEVDPERFLTALLVAFSDKETEINA